MGFGLTALLPILLKIVLSPESLLMIEEPESNLHPNFQAKLADLFVLAQKTFGIRFILETHSEYLIRRLQILTALKEHEYHLETDETALYYFYPPDEVPRGKEQVSRIHILEDGRLDKPFGSQFLDMSDEQMMDLYDVMED